VDDDDLERLVAAAAGGDQMAWDALVARFKGLLWAIARSYRLSTTDASDVVQMTWLRLVENLDRIQEPRRLAYWLATTARRESLQLLRRSGREQLTAVPEHLEREPSSAAALDAALLLDERDAALWRAVDQLPSGCQQLLRVLMAVPPPAYAEVAAALDMPIGSIGPSRQRCLAHLRRLVQADEVLSGAEGAD
jgi:RNA polymerase sigma factor (sigma-70 family)